MTKKTLIAAFLVIVTLLNTLCVPVFADIGEKVVFDDLQNLYRVYEASNVKAELHTDEKFGDASRAYRTAAGKGHLIYEAAGLTGAVINTYETGHIRNGFQLLVSSDLQEWTELKTDKKIVKQDTWINYSYTATDIPSGIKYFKVLFTEDYTVRKQIISYTESQLGSVQLNFDENVSDQKVVFSKENALTTSFADEFDTIDDKWTVQSVHKDYVKTAKVDGRNCLQIYTNSHDGILGSSDPYIIASGLKLEGKTYELEVNMMADSFEFDRTIMIGTNADGDTGRYLYPISFSENGTIGYRCSKNYFKDFETPYNYELGRWYNIRALIDTEAAMLIVYIDGEKVCETAINVLDWADGGIDEIRIVNRDTQKAEGSTYIDMIILSRGINLNVSEQINDSITEVFNLSDISGHWGETVIKKLTASGIISGYADKSFKPDNNISVDEFIKLALTAAGMKLNSADGYWAEPYIDKAITLGIISDGEFLDYTVPIKRQEMARMIVRTFDTDIPENDNAYIGKIADYDSIDENYRNDILLAYANGILNGSDGGQFLPLDNATRAEAATVILRAADKAYRRSAMYTVGIYSDEGYADESRILAESLPASMFETKILSKNDMSNSSVLNAEVLDCIVLLNSIEQDEKSLATFMSYLENGGDLAVGGEGLFYETLNTNKIPIGIYESYSYEPYNFDGGIKLVTAEGQDLFTKTYEFDGEFSGTAAIGFPIPCEQEYIPILQTKGKYGQDLCYAAGIMTNYYGRYNDSNWLIYGIAEKEFYSSDAFLETTTDALELFASDVLSKLYNREDIIARNKKMLEEYEITHEPPKKGFVHLSEDGRQLLDGEGNELFVIGASVYGPNMNFGSYGSYVDGIFGYESIEDGTYSVEDLEHMFRNAKDAGVNVFRWWYLPFEGKAKDVVVDLARKYEIYIYAVPEWSAYLPELKGSKLEPLIKAWGDEPMFIGVDLWNEPDWGQLLLAFCGNEDSPLMEYDLLNCKELKPYMDSYEWLMSDANTAFKWALEFTDEKMKKQVCAAWTLFKKLMMTEGHSGMSMYGYEYNPDCPEWIIEMAGKVIEKGLKYQTDIIHKYSDHALVTIGYFNAIAMWPNNTKYLDFWNHHVYQRANNYDDIMIQLTTFDRLNAIDEPRRIPAIFGEFCQSDGYILANGEMVDYENAVAFNVLNWLYAWANDYGGACIWTLANWNPVYYRHYQSSQIYAQRSGLYYYDGNPYGGQALKVSGLAMNFFKKFRDTHNVGDGEIEVIHTNARQSGTGFIFKGDTAEYVNNTEYFTERLQFKTPDGSQPIVMTDWSLGYLEIMSTQDTTVTINPSGYIDTIKASEATTEGLHGEISTEGDFITIELLAGETVAIKAK